MATILNGAPVAAALSKNLAERVNQLKEKAINPTLAIVRVGKRPADIAYETSAVKRCRMLGISVKKYQLAHDCTPAEITSVIREINADSSVHGCLMFRPLPKKDTESLACALLDPQKDVDCMTPISLSSVFTGKGAGYPPCTAQACIELLDFYGVVIQGKRVAVIGRSLVIGRPVAMLLQRRNATVIMCHTKTVDMSAVCRNAEIVVAAAGKAGLVDASCAAPEQVVIDVGINSDQNDRLCGDVRFDAVEPLVKAITPVPAGVGSVTTAVLAKHIVEAAEKTLA